jgi:hypothetical protein
MNLDNIGVSTVKDSTAFKKIQFFSKTNPTSLFNVKSDFQNSFDKLSNYYLTDLDLNESYTYGMDRQHTYTPLSSTLPTFSTLVDNKSVDKFLEYSLGKGLNVSSNKLDINRFNYSSGSGSDLLNETLINNFSKLLPSKLSTGSTAGVDFETFLKIPSVLSVLGAENDSKQSSNSLKTSLNFKHKKKNISNMDYILNNSNLNNKDVEVINPSSMFSGTIFNTENNLKFKDYKSSNAQFLGSERTVRLLDNVNSNSYK